MLHVTVRSWRHGDPLRDWTTSSAAVKREKCIHFHITRPIMDEVRTRQASSLDPCVLVPSVRSAKVHPGASYCQEYSQESYLAVSLERASLLPRALNTWKLLLYQYYL